MFAMIYHIYSDKKTIIRIKIIQKSYYVLVSNALYNMMTINKSLLYYYHLYSDKQTLIDIKLYKSLVIFICDISNENNTQQH